MIQAARDTTSVHLMNGPPIATRGEATERVIAHLAQKGCRFEVLPHHAAATALDEAGELHLYADSVVKALLVYSPQRGMMIAALPASRRIDMNLLRESLDDPDARLASEDEITRVLPWVELGALPALGSLLHVPMLVDIELLGQYEVVFAAGTRTCSIKMRTDDYLEGEAFSVADIAMHRWWVDIPV